MISKLDSIIPGFELDPNNFKNKSILVEDSNACSGEWITYSLLELFLKQSENTSVIFVGS